MGAYHGKAGFDTFSHYRPITESRLRGSAMGLTVPPVSPRVGTAIDWVARKQATRLRKRIDRFAESHTGAGQPRVTITNTTESNGRRPDSRDRQAAQPDSRLHRLAAYGGCTG